jgi:uncharacterized hydrophobic protein (TIGR00271 family)
MTIAIAFCGVTEHQRQLEWASRFALAENENLLILDVARSSTEDVVGTVKPDSEPRNADLGHATARLAETGLHWVAQFTDEPEQPSDEETNYKTDEKETDEKSNEDAAEMPVEDSTEVPIEDSPFKLQVELKEIRQPQPVKTILELLGQQNVSLLILPRQRKEKSTSPEFAIERQLFQQAPCMVVQLRVASSEKPIWHHSLLVAAGGGPHTGATLRLASRLATATDSRLTAMYVEPNVDDVAELVGQTILDRIVRKALKTDADRVLTKVVMSHNPTTAIEEGAKQGHDLLLLGATHHNVVHRFLFSSSSERLLNSVEGAAVAVVRPPIPWTSRLLRGLEQSVQLRVPQLDRTGRIELVERVQSSSKWDFDFMALICLSTFIASIGLIQDSAAVVIGAMLLAPLMTPLLGAGLSLVQGNAQLLRNTARTVAQGFLLAFAIGVACGLLIAETTLPHEMAARGSPRAADLLVAFASGIAAAFAIGRPNLLSALPGVAIAAALVPPVATAGLCTAWAEWDVASGALLLFLTNIVAIILGSACSLYATGIRGSHHHGRFAGWVPRVAMSLILIASGLAVYEVMLQQDLSPELRSALEERINREELCEYLAASPHQQDGQRRIDILIASSSKPSQHLLNDLMRLVHAHDDQAESIRLETRRVLFGRWETTPDKVVQEK